MKSIGHVKDTVLDFLGDVAFLKRTANRIAFIGHQPDFDTDTPHLYRLLNIYSDIITPTDDVIAHRNPSGLDLSLSEVATANLEKWYKNDLIVYEWCLKERVKKLNLFMEGSD